MKNPPADKILCVGGPMDGKWIKADHDRWNCVVQSSALGAPESKDPLEPAFQQRSYRRFITPGGAVMLADGVGVGDMVAKLIAGYVPGERVEGPWHATVIGGVPSVTVDADGDIITEMQCRGCQLQPATVVFGEPARRAD